MTSAFSAGVRSGIHCGFGDEIPAPANRITVTEVNRAVLYLPDGRALVRQIGFHGMAQTSGTMPQLSGNTKYGGKKGGKGKGGKKGC